MRLVDEHEARAVDRVPLDEPPLLLVERAVVLEDVRRHLHLADVVQEAADPERDRLIRERPSARASPSERIQTLTMWWYVYSS